MQLQPWQKSSGLRNQTKPRPEVEPAAFELDIAIRDGVEDDHAFIISTWSAELSRTIPWTELDRNWFQTAQGLLIKFLLSLPVVSIRVACSPEYADQIFGYIVSGPGRVLHWVNVKPKFRETRVGTRLMLDAFGGFDESIRATGESRVIGFYVKRWNLVRDSHILCRLSRGDFERVEG